MAKDQSNLHPFYEKVKSIFPILLETDWEVAFEMLKNSLTKFEFVYVIQIGLINCS